MKSKLLISFSIAALLLPLAACGGGETTTSPSPAESPAMSPAMSPSGAASKSPAMSPSPSPSKKP